MGGGRGRSAPLSLAFVTLFLAACGSDPGASVVPTVPAVASSASVSASASADLTPTPEPTASATPTSSPIGSYTVQRGDTLTSIARRFGTTIQQIQEWNAERYPALARNPDALSVGWVLIVGGDPVTTPQPTTGQATPPAQPTPPPVAAECSAGNRLTSGEVVTYAAIPNAGPGVALTFDMGGRMDPAVDIMEFLVANEVCATIFATGVMSESDLGREVLAIIRAHPELFEIANHTMYHCDLARGGGGSPTTGPCQTGGAPGPEFIREELTDAEAILRDLTDQSPQPYWRPPYGSLSQTVIDAAASVGYTATFMWDIDTVDWKPTSDGGPSAQQIAAKVVTQAGNGSNVLFHLGGYETLDALRIIVPALRERGFTLTSLSDLLR